MRLMLTIVGLTAAAVFAVPSHETPAAASDGLITATAADAPKDVALLAGFDYEAQFEYITKHFDDLAELIGSGLADNMIEAVELHRQLAKEGVLDSACPPDPAPLSVDTAPLGYTTQCNNGVCRLVPRVRTNRGPERSVVVRNEPVATSTHAYHSQRVFRTNERFMQRGPARRFCGRAARVLTAPIRWLRCR